MTAKRQEADAVEALHDASRLPKLSRDGWNSQIRTNGGQSAHAVDGCVLVGVELATESAHSLYGLFVFGGGACDARAVLHKYNDVAPDIIFVDISMRPKLAHCQSGKSRGGVLCRGSER